MALACDERHDGGHPKDLIDRGQFAEHCRVKRNGHKPDYDMQLPFPRSPAARIRSLQGTCDRQLALKGFHRSADCGRDCPFEWPESGSLVESTTYGYGWSRTGETCGFVE